MARTKKPTLEKCHWIVDDDGRWDTECGEAFQFEVDGPRENGFRFCPYCGLKLVAPNR